MTHFSKKEQTTKESEKLTWLLYFWRTPKKDLRKCFTKPIIFSLQTSKKDLISLTIKCMLLCRMFS